MHLLGIAGFCALLTTAVGQPIELERTNEEMGLAADPAASGGVAVTVPMDGADLGATNQWPLVNEPLGPGLYRCALKLRLHLPKDFDSTRLVMTVTVNDEKNVLTTFNLDWAVFDGRAGQFTTFTREFTLLQPAKPVLHFKYVFTALPPTVKKRAVRPAKIPTLDDVATTGEDFAKTFAKSLAAEKPKPLTAFTDPVVLIDTVELQRLHDGLVIAKVWPDKIHVYPDGEPNPVTVTVRNFQSQPATATVRFTVHTGLNEVSAPQEQSITAPAAGTATCRFDWKSGNREYGHGATAELLVAGKVVHSRTEYFSVSTPIWKTQIQGPGFLTWYNREHLFPEHVQRNRNNYINVEEAFSWQPSSWTDLNPTNDHWFTGQGGAHNSRRGLDLWMSLSHSQGIKLITYNWPTASGPAGFEWCRRNPWLMSRNPIGLGSNFDIDDFRLDEITTQRGELWPLRQGNWHHIWVNLGMLPAIEVGVSEIIKSAKTFGWDGVRFDYPPEGWGAWDAADVHRQFAEMGVSDLMQKLLPEYYGIKTGQWDGVATSTRNVRYIRHRLATELGPRFAVGYNFSEMVSAEGVPAADTRFFAECCRNGGQIMDERIRNFGTWESYARESRQEAGIAREHGGFHECVALNSCAHRSYAAIFTFAAGSHPYLDYGWAQPMQGRYTPFMTRYGEYCWDLDFRNVDTEKAGLAVSAPLWWKQYTRFRKLPNGTTQTVINLISPPVNDAIQPGAAAQATTWLNNITVRKRGTAPPTVWRLSAEPDIQREKLEPRPDGDGFAVTIPEHRLWTLLVWEDAQ
ncbi:MAG: hypothetical protein PCFJNLEI_03841 [Verrucomicrobiae bacterium]|nr:hypothetical protein [Verrucomicrobiae bacterium]